MTDDDISIDEKRVYADKTGTTTLFVACGVGVARVTVSDDIVGEFTLERRGAANDVATAEGRLAVATDEDVFLGTDGEFTETGFGPADAVDYDEQGRLVAAGDGRIARYDDGWSTLGELDGVRAIDGEMVAATSGIHRLNGDHVGLDAAHDVTTTDDILAATDAGLYYLANGWMDALDGEFRAVESAADGRVHAASEEHFYQRADSEWRAVDLPVDGAVAAVAYGNGTYAVTDDGTVLVDVGDGWRHRSLGLAGVTGAAVLY